MNKPIMIFYLSCHKLLKRKFGINRPVSRKIIFGELGRHFLIPKNLRENAIKELEEMKLMKKVDRDNVIILSSDLALDDDKSKFCKSRGFY